MQPSNKLLEMARTRYGYGRWEAPYWFIGLEEGMDATESAGREERIQAWNACGVGELDDCRKFHDHLFCMLEKDNRWHSTAAVLQSTWKMLMLVLLGFPDGPPSPEHRLAYQREKGGMLSGTTCLIELSGIAARSLEEDVPRDLFRGERVERIIDMSRTHSPRFIVMYGSRSKGEFRDRAKRAGATLENIACTFEQYRTPETLIAIVRHPVMSANAHWIELGSVLKESIGN